MTHIIDGRQLAAKLKTQLATQVAQLTYTPSLKVILVGDHPASAVYVANKSKAAKLIGIDADTIRLSDSASEADVISMIKFLQRIDYSSNETRVDGILVQLPLPAHINAKTVIEAIEPERDVDGFHPLNVGYMEAGGRHNTPCTPKGIMMLLQAAQTPLEGADVVVVGCSQVVGKPVSTLLTQAHATVTVAHKQTRDLASVTRRADVIVVAAGSPNLIRGDMIKPGVTIIDVGINRQADGSICGDVAFDECLGIAGAITPVPGGVGPMTVTCLLDNTVQAAVKYRAQPRLPVTTPPMQYQGVVPIPNFFPGIPAAANFATTFSKPICAACNQEIGPVAVGRELSHCFKVVGGNTYHIGCGP